MRTLCSLVLLLSHVNKVPSDHVCSEAGLSNSVQAIADRLAEAFAEKLHEIVRKADWGYAADEALSTEDLLKVKYQVGGPIAPSLVKDPFPFCTE